MKETITSDVKVEQICGLNNVSVSVNDVLEFMKLKTGYKFYRSLDFLDLGYFTGMRPNIS